MLSLATARFVVVIAVATLLPETAQFAQTVIHLNLRRILPLARQLPSPPFEVDTNHVVHAERPHGETEPLQRRIHLIGISAFKQHLACFQHVGFEHAVANETLAVARHHADLAHALAQVQRGFQHRR
ncbi:hypothetical protein D3C84_580260 [compost metagenome]